MTGTTSNAQRQTLKVQGVTGNGRRGWMFGVARAVVIASALLLGACSSHESEAKQRLSRADGKQLRRDLGKLVRDYFAVPGLTFASVRRAQWPASVSALNPQRLTVYADGAALALGGDAGTSEWGIHIVPDGFERLMEDTQNTGYRQLEKGAFFYYTK